MIAAGTEALPHVALYVLVGGLLGALGGLFGIGGGVIAIPVLGFFFGLDQQHAQGTALVMVAPNVFLGLRGYARRGGIEARVAVLLAASAVTFTALGGLYATRLAGPGLRIGFAAFILLVALSFALRALHARGQAIQRTRVAWGWTGLVGAGGGLLSGIFAVGGAVFAVPFLSLLFGYSQFEAQGLGLALVAPGTLTGIATYAVAGDVVWPIGLHWRQGARVPSATASRSRIASPSDGCSCCSAGFSSPQRSGCS